jgi:hypothetical protein
MRKSRASAVAVVGLLGLAAPAAAAPPGSENNIFCTRLVGSEQQLQTIHAVNIDDNYAFSAQPKKQCPGPFEGQGS